jgi:hypothetical protein
MRLRIVLLATLILGLGLTGLAQSETTSAARGNGQPRAHMSPRTQTIEQLARSVAKAWDEGKLGSLDVGRPYVGSVKVFVEDTIGERPEVHSQTFRTLAQVGRSFGKETADGPGRNVGPLEKCSKGVCTFEVVGMNHNNLFLQKITYGMKKGKPYLKAIYILNGD